MDNRCPFFYLVIQWAAHLLILEPMILYHIHATTQSHHCLTELCVYLSLRLTLQDFPH